MSDDDITTSAAWQRGTAAAKALPVAPPADVAKDREDKWRAAFAKSAPPPTDVEESA